MVGPLSTSSSANVKKVMISSTARDLPDHRKGVLDACLRQGMFPVMMEHLPASDDDAIAELLRMVNESDIYLGIFAYRYGYVPKGYNISVTEMEYNRAVERGMPRLIFIIDKAHVIHIDEVEIGEGTAKIEALKARMTTERVVNFFKSPAELQAQVIDSLSFFRHSDLKAFEYVSNIPSPPEPYIAHPYTLLQTQNLVGRQAELNLLTDWISKPSSEIYPTRILNIVAIGGMGKSALTWEWFNKIASQEIQPLVGRLWWSFYESDSTFENFVIRALAYATRQPKANIRELSPFEREEELFAILDHEPYLLVLDGLERILIAYARMDAAHLVDDDLDQQTANYVAGTLGLPESAAQSFIGQHRLRRTADPRIGNYLRKLARVKATRILVSTRLYPADLQTNTGRELPGCKAIFLKGLSDDDAIDLWRSYGASGSRDALLELFHTFNSHPLLIQALAGEIAHFRHSPGNFSLWRKAHPDFNPFSLPLVQVKSHVLTFALNGLNESAWWVLIIVAAFRMPVDYDTLAALLVEVKKDKPDNLYSRIRRFRNENYLIATLSELEDRGLLGWDRRDNRYDLHPLVRGVIWSGLDKVVKNNIYEELNKHFEPLAMVNNQQQAKSLADLTTIIELYNALIGLGRYLQAAKLFQNRIDKVTLYHLGTMSQRIELLELLFPDGLDQLPYPAFRNAQSYVLNALALSLKSEPGRAATFFRRTVDLSEKDRSHINTSISLCNLSNVLLLSGSLFDSQLAVCQALILARSLENPVREVDSLCWLGLILALRGNREDSTRALDRSLVLAYKYNTYKAYDFQAKCALWAKHYANVRSLCAKAKTFFKNIHYEIGMVCVMRLQGETALGQGDLSRADDLLHQALIKARNIDLIEEELQAIIGLAELRRRQGDLIAAHELLNNVWEPASRGPFRLFHADACNVLAQIERDEGHHKAAKEAALDAYRLAWCDGPPFAYDPGLEKARSHLSDLGAAEPNLPPFELSGREQMPEVEIDAPLKEIDENQEE